MIDQRSENLAPNINIAYHHFGEVLAKKLLLYINCTCAIGQIAELTSSWGHLCSQIPELEIVLLLAVLPRISGT